MITVIKVGAIKEPYKPIFEFTCYLCDCEWTAEQEDVTDVLNRNTISRERIITCLCPTCGNVAIVSETIYRGE